MALLNVSVARERIARAIEGLHDDRAIGPGDCDGVAVGVAFNNGHPPQRIDLADGPAVLIELEACAVAPGVFFLRLTVFYARKARGADGGG